LIVLRRVSVFLLTSVLSLGQYVVSEEVSDIDRLYLELKKVQSLQKELDERTRRIETELQSMRGGRADRDNSDLSSVATGKESSEQPKLSYSGDLRLRFESNFGGDAASRNREVIRTRLRALYDLDDRFGIGAELVTGDRDDPNTADVTLSQFADDIDVGLSQLYVKGEFGRVSVWGGKFPNPFTKTDLVWDGDVNPQGFSAAWTPVSSSAFSIEGRAAYVTIDENSIGHNSTMNGVQINLNSAAWESWKTQLAVAFYDYDIQFTDGANEGDFRSNLRAESGDYLSDFNLIDVVAGLSYFGVSDKWPISIKSNLVKNSGAATSADSGYSLRVSAGDSNKAGGIRLLYGYAQIESDGVFAAFSNDNMALATNYKAHELGVDFTLSDAVKLNLTWYRYKTLDNNIIQQPTIDDWTNRVRLNSVFYY